MSSAPQHNGAASVIVAERATRFFMALFIILGYSGALQHADARLERQAYVAYRTPHLCSYQIMQSVACPDAKPMCCVASSAIRCCSGTTSCGNCTEEIVGYEMPKSSVIVGCFSLSVLVLLGSIIMSGVGRHLAWVLEHRRVIENYRKRLLLRRAEAREFKKELAETEVKDIDDTVGCVICCARHIDVALTPCGHVCCCHFCAKRLRECPVCRSALQRCFDLPLYYVKQLLSAAEAAEDDNGGGVSESALSPTEMATITCDSATATSARAAREEDPRGAGEAAFAPETAEDHSVESAMASLHSNCCSSSTRSGIVAGMHGSTERPTRSTLRVVGTSEMGMVNPFRSRYSRVPYSDEYNDGDGRNKRMGSGTASASPLVRRVPATGAVTSPSEARAAAVEEADTATSGVNAHHSHVYISVER
ncbi:hypothetical protein, unknown function [Leishmania infantum JPCM5]|uniref:Zinc_finger-__C3HC4_type_(RING_finger )_containing_protein_-__putative n=2 Tax=Leishmania infantum TaxID=5671 RepID=A0A6L0WNK4_LEIIN|nr:hypothetical protein, unknown function [Leishmania infantum JPCM5]CAC9455254.1 Zinc_finger-__C3HC4_type_(RING_finger)_containing_protein_-__putative [Leishmania infantum]CAM65949.1 hypothetical protein, unknown function [Leishmania infantum JPCM5]SUZ39578.1 Zinc_finger-__C3HC4_type_(RING_finger)_containing_protein_-__putative [Leishmania infantum]|eukprot:XP_001463584.1 hypothetical protein, unknown function [Leishmania infantum JPCM5]